MNDWLAVGWLVGCGWFNGLFLRQHYLPRLIVPVAGQMVRYYRTRYQSNYGIVMQSCVFELSEESKFIYTIMWNGPHPFNMPGYEWKRILGASGSKNEDESAKCDDNGWIQVISRIQMLLLPTTEYIRTDLNHPLSLSLWNLINRLTFEVVQTVCILITPINGR